MEHHLKVNLIADSLFVFPKDNKTTIFQMELVITNPDPNDIIPLKAEINVQSSLNWFSRPLQDFTITCDAAFCILREATLHETFYFSLNREVISSEQYAFYEILNETKGHKTIRFTEINFFLSDGATIGVAIAPW